MTKDEALQLIRDDLSKGLSEEVTEIFVKIAAKFLSGKPADDFKGFVSFQNLLRVLKKSNIPLFITSTFYLIVG